MFNFFLFKLDKISASGKYGSYEGGKSRKLKVKTKKSKSGPRRGIGGRQAVFRVGGGCFNPGGGSKKPFSEQRNIFVHFGEGPLEAAVRRMLFTVRLGDQAGNHEILAGKMLLELRKKLVEAEVLRN